MSDYLVRWETVIFDAESPEDAARQALETMRNPDSIATFFHVWEGYHDTGEATEVDLNPEWA